MPAQLKWCARNPVRFLIALVASWAGGLGALFVCVAVIAISSSSATAEPSDMLAAVSMICTLLTAGYCGLQAYRALAPARGEERPGWWARWNAWAEREREAQRERRNARAREREAANQAARERRVSHQVGAADHPTPAPAPPVPTTTYRTLDAWRERERANKAERELDALKRIGRNQKMGASKTRKGASLTWRVTEDRDLEEVDEEAFWEGSARGRLAAFTYVDSDGVVTDREIANWEDEGRYIRGVCLMRHAVRTFRKDRIENWIELE